MKRNVPVQPKAPPEDPRSYRSREVAKIARVSLRQLQWWDERRVITIRHVGHQRQYSTSDVLNVMVLAELRRKGLSLQTIRRSIRKIASRVEQIALDAQIGERNGATYLALSETGGLIALTDSPADAVKEMTDYTGPVVLVSVPSGVPELPKPKR